MASNEDYIAALKDFNRLLHATFQLSVKLNRLVGDSRKQIASALFAKINLGALSVTKLLPKDSEILPREKTIVMDPDRFCDVSSIASLCRNLVEASNLLYYFGIEEVSAAEIQLRLQIGDYQAVKGSIAVFHLVNYKGERLEELQQELAKLKTALESSPAFMELASRTRKQILDGRTAATISHREIASRRGLAADQFSADYRHLSGHVHSDAYALLDLLAGRRLGGPMTVQIRESLLAMIREATRYLAMTCQDMMRLFPEFQMTAEGLEKIRQFTSR
jgi:hypothetical protein